jgi:Leucine-rich repeat (LRR) protein
MPSNQIRSIPHEILQMQSLRILSLKNNKLEWLPVELRTLLPHCSVLIASNLLPFPVEQLTLDNADDVFGAMTHLESIRWRATTICVAMQAMALPALVLLEIIDAALPNSIRMKSKWDLIVSVKHFVH